MQTETWVGKLAFLKSPVKCQTDWNFFFIERFSHLFFFFQENISVDMSSYKKKIEKKSRRHA